jgi:hypothetical protein
VNIVGLIVLAGDVVAQAPEAGASVKYDMGTVCGGQLHTGSITSNQGLL